MSSIVLSSAVRQNLLSLQDTANLLATTQTALSTGNKVNSALDNPTNFFTSQGLNNRATDISNLLDGISNGVQVIQAANTGITSIESLLTQAQSIANQALQAPVGYSTKSSVTTAAITNNGVAATASNLLGTGTLGAGGTISGSALTAGASAAGSVTGSAVATLTAGTTTPGTVTGNVVDSGSGADASATITGTELTTATTPISATTKLSDLGYTTGSTLVVNGSTITLGATAGAGVDGGAGSNSATATTLKASSTIGDLIGALNGTESGATITLAANQSTLAVSATGVVTVTPGTGNTATNIQGLGALGIANESTSGSATGVATTYIGVGTAAGSSALSALSTPITSSDSLTVNGVSISFNNTGTNSILSTGASLNAGTSTLTDLVNAINTITGASTASIAANGALSIASGTSSNVTLTGSVVSKLGLSTIIGPTASVTAAPTQTAGAAATTSTALNALATPLVAGDTLTVNGKTLSFGAASTSVNAQGGSLAAAATVSDLLSAIGTISGGTATLGTGANAGKITVTSASGAATTLGGTALAKLGLSGNTGVNASVAVTPTSTPASSNAINSTSLISNLASAITSSDTLSVNGVAISFAGTGSNTIAATGSTLNTSTATVQNVLDAIDAASGGTASIDNNGKITLTSSSGTAETITGSVLQKLGLTSATSANPSSLTVALTQSAGSYAPGFNVGTSVQYPAGYTSGLLSGTALTDSSSATVTSATLLSAIGSSGGITSTSTLTINGKTIAFGAAGANSLSSTGASLNANATVGDLLNAINTITGAIGVTPPTASPSTISAGGVISLDSGNTSTGTLVTTGSALKTLGLTTSLTATLVVPPTAVPPQAISGNSLVSQLPTAIAAGSSITVNGKTISFTNAGPNTSSAAGATLNIATTKVSDVLNAISTISGGVATIDNTGAIKIGSSATTSTVIGGTAAALGSLGLTAETVAPAPIAGNSSTATGSTALSDLGAGGITSSDTLTVNGQTITFGGTGPNSISSTGATLSAGATVSDLLNAISTISGGTATINANGDIAVSGANGQNLSLTGTALAKLGLDPTSSGKASVAAANQSLSFGAIGNGTATTVTFGTGAGQVSTLAQLNTALSADNLQATLASNGALTITTTNDDAALSIGTIGGTAFTNADGSSALAASSTPVADATATATRTNLVSQYNAILTQIDNTAADSSYNGVNLLNGDQLQLTFDETGKSSLSITGIQANSAGLGLSTLQSSAFDDNADTNKILTNLTTVGTNLRAQASAFGSNLSVVQTRQDFNKSLINVLQTGSANLTQADINTEAADSQALQTRQSLSVSALSLANQSQQSVLQLLR